MSFWSGKKLSDQMPGLVTDYSEHRIDCAAYTLRMGRQYYLSASEEDAATNKLRQLATGEALTVPSGQFAVLLTEESVTVPADAIAFISMKTSLKGRGLVNVSGFHVDPGYSATLRFSVFNAGPSPICIRQGEDCFLIWYADLDQRDDEHAKKESQNRKYAKGINSNDVSSITGAVKSIDILSRKVEQIQATQHVLKVWISVIAAVAMVVVAPFAIWLIIEGIQSLISP